MSDEKKPRTPEVVKSDVPARREERAMEHIPFSRFLFRAKKNHQALEEHARVLKAQAEVVEAGEILERTVDRFRDLPTILTTDQKERDLKLANAETALDRARNDLSTEKRRARQEALRAELEEAQLTAALAKARAQAEAYAKPPEIMEKQPRSAVDNLRAAVQRDTEFDAARLQVLADERRKCEEKIRRKEMTVEEMEHYLARVEASIDRHTGKKL